MIQKENIVMKEKVGNWEEAIRLSAQPLIDNGYIEESYVEAIFENTEKNGPYYVLAPEIAMPHASPQAGVKEAQISLLVMKEPIYFSKDGFPVRLVFTLAAVDETSHLTSLQKLANVFADEALIQKIIDAQDVDEVCKLIA
ncbi:MAG TPA: PTS sugar transporter subunit IIA [Erysipelothrix sp.]